MIDLRNKFKRQIEILGICLSQNYPGHLDTFDLAEFFGVEELTIKRDLRELRAAGIDIHSVKRRGINIMKKINDERLRELIHQYSALCSMEDFVEKSTSLLVKRLREKAIANMVTIQRCIENHKIVRIDYEKDSSELEFGREIYPILIYQSDSHWRVLATSEGKIKQFLLIKIVEARETERTFTPQKDEDINELFRFSWRSWLGHERINVKLKLTRQWTDYLKPKPLMENENLILNKDGTSIYETTVNTIEEIAGWIAGKGEGIQVLEPEKLRDKVIDLAKGVLKNYNKVRKNNIDIHFQNRQ